MEKLHVSINTIINSFEPREIKNTVKEFYDIIRKEFKTDSQLEAKLDRWNKYVNMRIHHVENKLEYYYITERIATIAIELEKSGVKSI